MWNSTYYLHRLAQQWQPQLKGMLLLECFTQNKGELLLGLANADEELWLRAQLEGSELGSAFITTYQNFNRARQNSTDIWPWLKGSEILGIVATPGDRSLSLILHQPAGGLGVEGYYMLLFRLHGVKGNVVLFSWPLDLPTQEHDPDQWVLAPQWQGMNMFLKRDARVLTQPPMVLAADVTDPRVFLNTIGKEGKAWLEEQGYEDAPDTIKSSLRAALHTVLMGEAELAYASYHCTVQGHVFLTLMPVGDVLSAYDSALAGLKAFVQQRLGQYGLAKEKARLVTIVQQRIKQTETYLAKTRERLLYLTTERNPEELGHLLMAEAHNIKPLGMAHTVQVPDWYNTQPDGSATMATILIKPQLTAQQQAAYYYNKARNRAKELVHLKEQVEVKENLWLSLQELLPAIEQHTYIKELRLWAREQCLSTAQKAAAAVVNVPYKQFWYQGYEIRVGKNSAANDQLTLKHAHKDDLWLHARGVAGSHVIIKVQAGRAVPDAVVNHAAGLAVWYSKGKHQPNCPVIVTPRKFIRKPKGSAPGSVQVERESVVFANAIKPQEEGE